MVSSDLQRAFKRLRLSLRSVLGRFAVESVDDEDGCYGGGAGVCGVLFDKLPQIGSRGENRSTRVTREEDGDTCLGLRVGVSSRVGLELVCSWALRPVCFFDPLVGFEL
ncbi:Uncharacterized protein Rs2_00960 [Raphanus sativus]|nr:Uncharacterized protein Rs2_00960 [Raphanus sativus]